MKFKLLISTAGAFISSILTAFAQQRFPEPEFESGHVQPPTQAPAARGFLWEYLDVVLLVALLGLITYFILKKRSRKGVLYTSIFSLVYFGFFREGCVCSVGSIQNMALSLFESSYVVPLSVVIFFAVPLIFTLLFGRTFCAGICIFGALQDLVILKPQKISRPVENILKIIPYLYLAFALLFAALGADFIICRYDPFISFFRFGGSVTLIAMGITILLIGIFIARPYCRFICPYGVILGWLSKISFFHLKIAPAACVNCKLCENSCPVDAIKKPIINVQPENIQKASRRLIFTILSIPVWMFIFGFVISAFSNQLSYSHVKVRLADEIKNEIDQKKKSQSVEAVTFNASGTAVDELFREAAVIQKNFYRGAWIIGAFLGLAFGIGLVNLSRIKTSDEYSADKTDCVGCARCFKDCPVKIESNNVK